MTLQRFTTVCLKPCICVFLMMSGVHGVTLAMESADLRVEYIGNGNPAFKIKAKIGCITTEDAMTGWAQPCGEGDSTSPVTIEGVCTKEGGLMCPSSDVKGEKYITIQGSLNEHNLVSSNVSLDNITFYSEDDGHPPTSWTQKGNISTFYIKAMKGVSNYELKFELKEDKTDKGNNCSSSTKLLKGDVGQDIVTFTANWYQDFIPGCMYKNKGGFLMDYCDKRVARFNKKVEDLQYIKEPAVYKEELSKTPIIYAAASGMIVFMVVVAMVLLLVLLHHRQRLRSSTARRSGRGTNAAAILPVRWESLSKPLTPQLPPPARSPPLVWTEQPLATRPPFNILLVYTPCLSQEMAALSAQLENKTGLLIEDLYGVGDHDKLNDPTLWLTRRLMDVNTRLVLAISSSSPRTHNNGPGKDPKQGGVFHFLLNHLLQHLQSSNLAQDYTRVHQIRLENQPCSHLHDVTPGRLYNLPAHLDKLAANLVLKTCPIPEASAASEE